MDWTAALDRICTPYKSARLVLSRFPVVHADQRLVEMLSAITQQADGNGRYMAGSMHMAWKGWGFADKKAPSPWISALVLRIVRRASASSHAP